MHPLLIPRLVSLLIFPVSLFGQGSLAPSGTPMPTMKTLQQIEPRIDLQNAPASAVTTTNASYEYVITQGGSYYLSANLAVTKPNGILINVEGVSLDLRGFQVARSSGSGGDGIFLGVSAHRAKVFNGSIKGFADGVESPASAPRGCAYRDLSVSNCTNHGIYAGFGATVESCRVHDCSGGLGISTKEASNVKNCAVYSSTVDFAIYALNGCTISDSTVSSNVGNNGIFMGAGSTAHNCAANNNAVTYAILAGTGSSLANCAANANTSADFDSGGIYASAGCTITHCSAYGNLSTATANAGRGLGFSIDRGTIQNCTAANNQGDGIVLRGNTIARDNTCANNGLSGDGAGIHVLAGGSANRIESNNVTANDRGIDVDGTHNLIVKNTAGSNANNFDIAADNRYGPIEDITAAGSAAASGNTATTTLGNNNAWANFAY